MKPVNCGCGGEAEVYAWVSGSYSCHCLSCKIETTNCKTPEEAVTAWNKAMSGSAEEKLKAFWDGMSAEMKGERTAKVETVEKPNVYKCSECGQYFHSTAWGSPVEYCSHCGCRLDWNEDIPMEYFESGGI